MSFAQAELNGMIIRMAPLGPIATNCYVIACARTLEGAIIDSSAEAARIHAMIEAAPAIRPTLLLQTHAHVDHVAALGAMHARLQLPIYLHPDDMELYKLAPQQGMMLGMQVAPLPAPSVLMKDGDTIRLGDLEARVLHTPGHTPGGVCFYFAAQGVLFSGDLLFAGSVGRTDLPGGHFPTLQRSLKRLLDLPDATLVLSGHGPETELGVERVHNPFMDDLEG